MGVQAVGAEYLEQSSSLRKPISTLPYPNRNSALNVWTNSAAHATLAVITPLFAVEGSWAKQGARHRLEGRAIGGEDVDANPLVGAWSLVSFEVRAADGRVSYPYGSDALGHIIYSPDGYMSVTIMSANRPDFETSDLLGGSLEERAEAARTYVSYSGPYEVLAGRLVHHVEVSLFPNWVGGSQERFYELEDDRLRLSTAPMLLSGSEQQAHLIWARVPSAV